MNITNTVITEYINGFYNERTTALKELRKRNEMNFVDTKLEDDFDVLVSQYESQYANQ